MAANFVAASRWDCCHWNSDLLFVNKSSTFQYTYQYNAPITTKIRFLQGEPDPINTSIQGHPPSMHIEAPHSMHPQNITPLSHHSPPSAPQRQQRHYYPCSAIRSLLRTAATLRRREQLSSAAFATRRGCGAGGLLR